MKCIQALDKSIDGRSNVLLIGETGTGKEAFALAYHKYSQRSEYKFIYFDVVSGELYPTQNNLFGNDHCVYCGSKAKVGGAFDRAQGGTLFINNIEKLFHGLQKDLLNVIERGRYQRPWGDSPIPWKGKIIFGTEIDPRETVSNGQLEKGLFYRLMENDIELPPIRERMKDLPILIKGYLYNKSRMFTGKTITISPETLDIFSKHSWPRNIHEVKAVISRLIERSNEDTISSDTLLREMCGLM